MKWQILSKDGSKDIIKTLLYNRGLKTKKDIEQFLHPPLPFTLNPLHVGIDKKNLNRALKRIKSAIKNEEPIVVYGDYDADGICASAIMWEALRDLGAKAMPYIPLREKEGYGLSKNGIDETTKDKKYGSNPLIITVDSGIVAHEAVSYAKRKKLEVIIIDHHEKGKTLPKAFAIVHTLQLCAAGIAFFVSKELVSSRNFKLPTMNSWLELAAIASVTDLIPLIGPNRSIVKFGLEALNHTTRPGLKALLDVAGIEKVGTYEIGYLIGPRINASGRIENALTALRLLCTNNLPKAKELANLLNSTNRDRQLMLEDQTLSALKSYELQATSHESIIIVDHASYHQGVIGLIAGKLVDKYYLPAIVIAKGETLSKASARSISGFNIIEAIRSVDELLVNAGGHPMAAGFTIETSKISEFKTQISKLATKKISSEMLEKTLRIDCELKLEEINMNLYNNLARFAPFGLGNPEPVFVSRGVVQNIRTVGSDGKHLKLQVIPISSNKFPPLDAIAFNKGALGAQLKVGDSIQIAYSIDLNIFNGNSNLQLKVKDIKTKPLL